MEAKELLNNPKFVALWIAIWVLMLLAVVNIYEKLSLLAQLGQ
ncbi:hypothetical protein [Methylocystis parvus]|nr:hypothetical protein [Methylocystis parvus]